MKHILHALLSICLVSCITDDSRPADPITFDGTGYVPVYASKEEMEKIEILPPQPLSSPGKIYELEPYLFINETGKGIHVINNADPRHPENQSFISIPGNYDIAAKGSSLYADNLTNLLVFDIRDPEAPKLVKTIANAIPPNSYPLFQNIYFECPDDSKGAVLRWEKVTMTSKPKCFR